MQSTNCQQDKDAAADAVLMIAFGGPERMEDVRPFLSTVTQGRVPQERLASVARHYELFDGRSPVKEVTFRQAEALKGELERHGTPLKVYVGMRNWHPFLRETIGRMKKDGTARAAGLIMSVFESKASWDQYQTDTARAVAEAGADLFITYCAPFYDQAGFLKAVSKRTASCLKGIPEPARARACLLFTAHSLPCSDPKAVLYSQQVYSAAAHVAKDLNHAFWKIAYQSRSGRPQDPWLEPDANDLLQNLAAEGVAHVVAVPIGFVCDNIEVLYDLDVQVARTAKEVNLAFLRAETVGDDPIFIEGLAHAVSTVIRGG
jgi:ferrochelatase